MRTLVLITMTLLACNASKDSTFTEPPLLVGGGGKLVPDGYPTHARIKNHQMLELAYTQITALTHEGRMTIELLAHDGRLPAKTLTVMLGVGTNKPTHVEDLAGRMLTPVNQSKLTISLRAGSPQDDLTASSATVAITNVTADAVDGTISADFDDWKLEGASFHAYRASLDDATLSVLARSTP